MARQKSSSGDTSKQHPYLAEVPETERERATIVRHEGKYGIAKWVQIYRNDVLIFSNKPA